MVSVDGTEPGLEAVRDGVLQSTVLLAPQYSGFWKAYFPYLVATKKNDKTDLLIQGVLVTKDNVAPAMKLAADQVKKVQDFPFEKPLKDIVETYK